MIPRTETQAQSLLGKLRLSRAALSKRILIPVNLISILALTALGYVMVRYNVTTVKAAIESKMEFAANFLERSGGTYLANYDLTALEGFVTETEKDQDVAYAFFADAQGKVLTKGTKDRSRDEGSLLTISRELKDADGKPLGKLTVAYTKDRLEEAFRTTFIIVFICIFAVQAVLSLALMGIARTVIQSMKDIIDRLSDASFTISLASEELSTSSDSLSRGVTKQAAAVQETVASMTQMSSMLAQTASNARNCNVLTEKVSEKTSSGTEIMERMVSAMSSIESANAQLHDMADIIKDISAKTAVINDIVFKTQLLSLNASIEAARAGQHGRGFAVVAEEVGNLAQLSGGAAKEIAALLESSMKDVERIVRSTEERVKEGRQVSDRALRTFKEIAHDISGISLQIQNINEAATEQEQGVRQSSNAMIQVDETTHTNSNVAKQAQHSSKLLAGESRQIAQITRQIRQLILGDAPVMPGQDVREESRDSDSPEPPAGDAGEAGAAHSAAALAERIIQRAEAGLVDASDSSFRRKPD
ncbi:MAG: methyl-accepting chemotaxis protein [Oligoflexia bacterium]|nr:methyl-accepting chemotaxis protein [Oligoflexia bacterium]